jgi:hypothetical protein
MGDSGGKMDRVGTFLGEERCIWKTKKFGRVTAVLPAERKKTASVLCETLWRCPH